MKTAVIGLGVMGSHHTRIYHELGVLRGVYDANPSVVDAKQAQYGCKGYSTLDLLLEDEELDAVSIAVPTPLHLSVAKKCMEAGLDVLLEKPIADTVEAGQELVDIATATGRILAVGYIERFNPAVQGLMNLVENGFFGQITSINVKRVGGIPRSANNIILDLMTHDLNLLIHLFNMSPDNIHTHVMEHSGIIDSAQSLMNFGDASATCEANWISPIKIRRIEITGTSGYAYVNLIKQTVTQTTNDYELTKKYNGEPLKNELSIFLEASKKGIPSYIVTAEDALMSLKVTLRALEGAKYDHR